MTRAGVRWGRTALDALFQKDVEKSYSPPLARTGILNRQEFPLKSRHLLGTNNLGEDVLYNALKGVRTAFIIGIVPSVIAAFFAILFGLLAGFYGGWIDDAIQYVYQVLSSIPAILLLIAMLMVMERGLWQLCVALGVTSWVGLCRLIRGETLKVKQMEYIEAARSLGASDSAAPLPAHTAECDAPGHHRDDPRFFRACHVGGGAHVYRPRGRAGHRKLGEDDHDGGQGAAERHLVEPDRGLGLFVPPRARVQPLCRRAAGRPRPAPEGRLDMEEVLRIEDLRTYFFTDEGVARAVDGVSLSVAKGRTLGLVGESGCGKSITALSILRLVPAPQGRIVDGRIVLAGREIRALPEIEMRDVRGKLASMIFQEPMTSLNPVFTIGSQIMEAVRIHTDMGRREAREVAVEYLAKVGIPARRAEDVAIPAPAFGRHEAAGDDRHGPVPAGPPS